MSLPEGVQRRRIDGAERLATSGEPVYGEPTADGWRAWDPGRSKLAAMLDRELDVGLAPDAAVLYLGAAAGTTVSHVADVTGPVYAVEFAARPAGDLVRVAQARPNVIPLLKDARQPELYAHVVESDLDVVVQDVATRDQATVAVANRQFLADDGRLALAIKARSEDVAADPETVYDRVIDALDPEYTVLDTASLAPDHDAHLAVIATPDR
ncbi:MAG: fibrillarin-like rRNA/tRNA 2'-O-methyltransferase [Halobacteriales archaeon]